MEDFPVRSITDSRGTLLTAGMGTINHRDVELCLIEDHLQEVLFQPVWILERCLCFSVKY